MPDLSTVRKSSPLWQTSALSCGPRERNRTGYDSSRHITGNDTPDWVVHRQLALLGFSLVAIREQVVTKVWIVPISTISREGSSCIHTLWRSLWTAKYRWTRERCGVDPARG